MLETLSPYQLLQASRPKQATITTDYDRRLCDAIPQQHKTQAASSDSRMQPDMLPNAPKRTEPPPPLLMKRTHYIADIHNRHRAAQRYLPSPLTP